MLLGSSVASWKILVVRSPGDGRPMLSTNCDFPSACLSLPKFLELQNMVQGILAGHARCGAGRGTLEHSHEVVAFYRAYQQVDLLGDPATASSAGILTCVSSSLSRPLKRLKVGHFGSKVSHFSTD